LGRSPFAREDAIGEIEVPEAEGCLNADKGEGEGAH
jgi:hypothetical protein